MTRASPIGVDLRRRAKIFVQPYTARIEEWNERVGHLDGLIVTRLTTASERLAIQVELEDIAFRAETLAQEIASKAGELVSTAPVVNAVAALKSISRRAQRKLQPNLN